MPNTRVFNKKTWLGGCIAPETYVGRPTVFGNPFKIGRDGTREAVVAKYKRYFWRRVNSDITFRQEAQALEGHALLCHCAPEPCHADVIAAWLNAGCPLEGSHAH